MRPHTVIIAACLIAAALIAGCGTTERASTEGPDRVAFTIADDFETNEMYGWESYPYAQDIGYDPRFLCQREPAHNGSDYALARIVMPNDALDLSEGFTKRIDLWTAPDTRLKCALFLSADRKPDRVDIMLGLFDGRLFTHTITSPEPNEWLELDLPASAFTLNGTPLGEDEHVQVVAIEAWYSLVTHLASYTILMDDFSINGGRDRQFLAADGGSTYFDKFGVTVLNRHFFDGDSFDLAVTPEGGVKLRSVTCDLIAPDGSVREEGIAFVDDGAKGDARSGDNVWANTGSHTFSAADPRGQWTARFTGERTDGGMVAWDIRFLVPPRRLTPSDHPRLFFTRGELDARLASEDRPGAKRILERALSGEWDIDESHVDAIEEDTDLFRESLTGGPYFKNSDSPGRWRRPLSRLGGIVEEGAFRYVFTGDEEAGRVAKKALLKLASFTVWNHPWMEAHGRHTYFPMAYMVKQVGIGYDFLHPLMTEEERAEVRRAIMEKGIGQFYRDMVEMNRMPSSLSNHIAVIVSGMGMAATAIYGEDPGNPALEPYLSGILTKMHQFIDRTYFPGGGYGEPYTYQAMASRDLTETLFALERNFGVDYTTTTDLRDLWIYPVYATHESGRYPDFGDVSLSYSMVQTHFQWLTHRMRNPWTAAYVQPYLKSGRGGFLGWLWYEDDIEPRYRTELPTSRHFEGKGNMVMRSDWEDDGTIIIFKCGPNSNHYHLDQGTFAIMTNGEELLSDAGHGSSYYANLYYPCYYTQPIGHNVMLVDNNPECQSIADYENGIAALRDYPAIRHAFAGNIADEVEGDLTCVYKGAVTRYTRALLHLKNDGPLFLFDRVASDAGHEYSWLFHAEHTGGRNSITYDDGRMFIDRPEARMTMDVIAPEIASHSIRDSDRDEGFITLRSAPGLRETTFLAVIRPEAGKGGPSSMKSESLSAAGFAAVSTVEGSRRTVAAFSGTGTAKTAEIGGYTVNGDRFAVTSDGRGRVAKLLVRGTELAEEGTGLFESSVPVTVAAAFSRNAAALDVDADTGADVKLRLSGKPSVVGGDGGTFDSWSWDAASNMITVSVPAGRTTLEIRQDR